MLVSRGLPTALPTAFLFGLRRYERVLVGGSLLRKGQFYLPDKEFRYLRTVIVHIAPHVAMRYGKASFIPLLVKGALRMASEDSHTTKEPNSS